MAGGDPKLAGLNRRDRALAELARARGWIDDESLDRVMEEASSPGGPGLTVKLIAARLLTPNQVASLEEAIDGVSRSTAGGADRTVVAPSSSSDMTVKAPSSASGFDATLRAPSSSSPSSRSDATIKAPSSSSVALANSGARLAMPDTFGGYKLMRELGRGGMGVVYRARHIALGREVALKVMTSASEADASDTERFRREAAILARLERHPNLVQIHEIGHAGDRLFFAMDYIEGKSLKDRLEDGAVPAREAAKICADVAGALEFVHKAGVVHRDVKPHNILLDRAGTAFLSDFGLARDEGAAGLTVSGCALGTPAYMSPEVAGYGARRATPRSDVYSLGATLFEALTRRTPFLASDGMDMVRQVVERDPPFLRALNPSIPRDLEIICLKALHKIPERRYASAADFEADLRRFLNGDAILARPVGPLERLLTRARRHKAVVVASALALAAAVGVAFWGGSRFLKGTKAEERDRQARAARQQVALPLLQEGVSLITRSDDADRNGFVSQRDSCAAQAVVKLRAAAEADPESAEVRFELGRALRRAGKWQDALAELERAVALNPQHSLAWFESGLIAMERFELQRGVLQRGTSLQRTNEMGYRATSGASLVLSRTEVSRDKGDWKGRAARDFGNVVNTGAAAERAAYGRAMLLYLDDQFEKALAALDESVKADPYFAPAVKAQATVIEYWTRDAGPGLPYREKWYRLEPRNPEAAIEYASSLAIVGRTAEAMKVVDEALQGRTEALALVNGGWVATACFEFEKATKLVERARKVARGTGEIWRVLDLHVEILAHEKKFDEALEQIEANRKLYSDDNYHLARAEMFYTQGKFHEASREYRQIGPGGVYTFAAASAGWAEWNCGNLDLAEKFNRDAIEGASREFFSVNTGVLLLERGKFDESLVEFEKVLKQNPDHPNVHSNIAGALFLKHDYAGAMQAIEAAFLRTSIPEKMKKSVQELFKGLKDRAARVKTPQDAARLVESMAAMLQLAINQSAGDPDAQGAAREGIRGIMYALQQFYFYNDMAKESVVAGKRHLAISKNGNIWVRHARALALTGKKEEAVEAVAEAMKLGFDDGSRLDGEPAFDAVRQLEGFRELRGKCRP